VPTFTRDGLDLYYAERGDPDGPPVVLLHGLTLSSRMMERLAEALPDHRVLLLDLHGHGKSSRPRDPGRYSLDEFVADTLALMDHLRIDTAVLGGTSLGANVSYEVALVAPERVRAMILEMPVFARGYDFGKIAFLCLAGLFAGLYPVLTPWHPLLHRVPLPRKPPELNIVRDFLIADLLAQSALMRGIVRNGTPPNDEATTALLNMPTLLIAHPHDPIHVLQDAVDTADHLPAGELVCTTSFLRYRLHPDELNEVVSGFLAGLG